jgi:predicted aspartyl protease
MEFIQTVKRQYTKLFWVMVTALLFLSDQNFGNIVPKRLLPPLSVRVPLSNLMPKNDEPLGDFQSLTIPLKRAGRLFLIEARIDDQVGNLIFDTGASGLVLNKTYFRKYASFEKPAGGGVTGAFDKIYQILVKRIDISGLYYENISADLTDLGHIENRRGIKILGLLGLNMIDNLEVIFDANNNELQLNRIDEKGNRISADISELKFDYFQKIETQHKIMLVKGKIGDKMLNFCLDTGAESNIINSNVPKKVMITIEIKRRLGLGGAGSAAKEVLYGTMNEFEFGNHQFGTMETIVTSLDAISEAYGCTIDGMLGFDFWQKGIFCMNFGKNEISFSFGKGGKK